MPWMTNLRVAIVVHRHFIESMKYDPKKGQKVKVSFPVTTRKLLLTGYVGVTVQYLHQYKITKTHRGGEARFTVWQWVEQRTVMIAGITPSIDGPIAAHWLKVDSLDGAGVVAWLDKMSGSGAVMKAGLELATPTPKEDGEEDVPLAPLQTAALKAA